MQTLSMKVASDFNLYCQLLVWRASYIWIRFFLLDLVTARICKNINWQDVNKILSCNQLDNKYFDSSNSWLCFKSCLLSKSYLSYNMMWQVASHHITTFGCPNISCSILAKNLCMAGVSLGYIYASFKVRWSQNESNCDFHSQIWAWLLPQKSFSDWIKIVISTTWIVQLTRLVFLLLNICIRLWSCKLRPDKKLKGIECQ